MNKNTKKKKKGFTLIELIIVLAIMAIIGAIAVPNFTSIRNSSKLKADNQSVEIVKRIVTTLVADGSVATPESGNAVYTVSFTSTGAIDKVKDSGNTENTVIRDALLDVKAPQVTGQKVFKITITQTTGAVSVVTAAS